MRAMRAGYQNRQNALPTILADFLGFATIDYIRGAFLEPEPGFSLPWKNRSPL